MDKLKDHLDENYRVQREIKRSYLSTISTRYNPDLIIGSIFGEKKKEFIRGNEYFMEQAKEAKISDERELEQEDGEVSEKEQPE
jgi:hypothetical protein